MPLLTGSVAADALLAWSTQLREKDGGGGALSPDALAPDEHAQWEWALGIILCLAGAAATNLGLTLQKRSFLSNDAASPSKQRSATRQPLWLTGLGVFLIGQTLNLLAFGYTSQAVAATLGSFSLVTNGVFAPCLLREKLTKRILISIGIIVLGSVAVVLSSSRAPQEYTLNELIHLLQRPLFVVYLTVLVVAFVLSLLLLIKQDRVWQAAHKASEEWERAEEGRALEYRGDIEKGLTGKDTPAGANSSFQTESSEVGGLQVDPEIAGQGAIVSKEITNSSKSSGSLSSTWHDHQPSSESSALLGHKKLDSPPDSPHSSACSSNCSDTSSDLSSDTSSPDPGRPPPPSSLTPILAAAILSSLSVLFGKCSIQLVKSSMDGENQFTHPLSWLLTGVFIVCAVSAVIFLNIGLRRGTALFVVPLYYVLNTLLAITGGLVYFEEFRRFSPAQGVLFGAGVATTIAGVWLSSRGQVEVEDGGVDSDDDDDESSALDTADTLEPILDADAEEQQMEQLDEEVRESPATATSEASPGDLLRVSPSSPRHSPSASPTPSPNGTIHPRRPSSALKSSRLSPDGAAKARRKVSHVHFDMSKDAQRVADGGVVLAMHRNVSEPAVVPGPVAPIIIPAPAASSDLKSQYGSLETVAAVRPFRAPSQPSRSVTSTDRVRRARSMSALPSGTQRSSDASGGARDSRLKSTGWKRAAAAHKRYSLDNFAYQSSFGRVVDAALAAHSAAKAGRALDDAALAHAPLPQRRYSVAVLGLGVS